MSATENSLNRQTNEYFQCLSEECESRVACGGKNGVDGETGSKKERGAVRDSGLDYGVENGGNKK